MIFTNCQPHGLINETVLLPRFSSLDMPLLPANKFDQFWPTFKPRGLTRPRPVITTRLFMSLFYE